MRSFPGGTVKKSTIEFTSNQNHSFLHFHQWSVGHPTLQSYDLICTKCSICQHTIFKIKIIIRGHPIQQLATIGLVFPEGYLLEEKDFRASDERYCSSPNLEGQWRVHVDLLKVTPIMIHHFDNKSKNGCPRKRVRAVHRLDNSVPVSYVFRHTASATV